MKTKRGPTPTTLAEAVVGRDPLLFIELIIDQGTPSWDWFVLMNAAISETHSGGPRMLLDRFTFPELKTICLEYARRGACNSAAAIREFIEYTESRFGSDPSEDQIIDLLDDPECQRLHRKHVVRFQEYCSEMERYLVAYVASHSNEFKKEE